MAPQRATFVLCSLLVSLLLNVAKLEVSALYLCPSILDTLSALEPCMDNVEGSSPVPPIVDSDCCYVIRSMEPGCLCNGVAGYKNSRSINIHAALLLPKACGRLVAVNYTCNGIPVPSAPMPPSRKLL